jgi:hypothetical protein
MKSLASQFLGIFILFGLLLSGLYSCTKNDTEEPTPTPVIAECERNHTAEVYFENRSVSNTTYDVIWDGSRLTTLSPGNRSNTYKFSAAQHTLEFRKTNTGTAMCTPSTPSLAQCSAYAYWCSY